MKTATTNESTSKLKLNQSSQYPSQRYISPLYIKLKVSLSSHLAWPGFSLKKIIQVKVPRSCNLKLSPLADISPLKVKVHQAKTDPQTTSAVYSLDSFDMETFAWEEMMGKVLTTTPQK